MMEIPPIFCGGCQQIVPSRLTTMEYYFHLMQCPINIWVKHKPLAWWMQQRHCWIEGTGMSKQVPSLFFLDCKFHRDMDIALKTHINPWQGPKQQEGKVSMWGARFRPASLTLLSNIYVDRLAFLNLGVQLNLSWLCCYIVVTSDACSTNLFCFFSKLFLHLLEYCLVPAHHTSWKMEPRLSISLPWFPLSRAITKFYWGHSFNLWDASQICHFIVLIEPLSLSFLNLHTLPNIQTLQTLPQYTDFCHISHNMNGIPQMGRHHVNSYCVSHNGIFVAFEHPILASKHFCNINIISINLCSAIYPDTATFSQTSVHVGHTFPFAPHCVPIGSNF